MLNVLDMNYGPEGELLTGGIFQEFYEAMGGEAFDVETAKAFFHELVEKEENITLSLETRFLEPIMAWDEKTVIGVKVKQKGVPRQFFARRIIDATQDADLAAASGVPFTIAGEETGRDSPMAATLVLQFQGVNWDKLKWVLQNDGDPHTGATEVSAWGFRQETRKYQPLDGNIRLRGLNIGRQKDGSVLVNSLQIFNVNGLDEASRSRARAQAQKEAPRVARFLRENIPGFEEAVLVGTAPELYVRETRHIIGEYRLNVNDVLDNRDFPDRIAIASYPVDIQSISPADTGFVIGNPLKYSIPFRCLVPKKVENLLVVGRSASYTPLAAGSARVVPIGMVTGQAAGAAAAYSLKHDLTFRELAYSQEHINNLQDILMEQGLDLKPFVIENSWEQHWAYPYVKKLRPLGLVVTGYSNELDLNKIIIDRSFLNLLYEGINRTVPGERPDREELLNLVTDEPLDKHKALAMLVMARGFPSYYRLYSVEELFEIVAKREFLSTQLQERLRKVEILDLGHAYAIIAETVEKLEQQNPAAAATRSAFPFLPQ